MSTALLYASRALLVLAECHTVASLTGVPGRLMVHPANEKMTRIQHCIGIGGMAMAH